MRGLVLASVVVVAVTTGCGGDVPALQDAHKRLLADRDELAQVAARIDDDKSEVSALQSKLERLEGAGEPEPTQVETLQDAAVKGIEFEEPEEGGFRISGPGKTTDLATLAKLTPFLPVSRFEAAGPRWMFEVPLSDATVPAPPVTAPREYGVVDIPKRHLRSLESVRLRDEIDKLLKEVVELSRIGAEAREFQAKKSELAAAIDRANRPDRLHAVARAAEALFGGAKAPCAGGIIRTGLEKMVFECAAALDAKRAGAALLAAVPAGYSLDLAPGVKPKGSASSDDLMGSGRYEILSGSYQRKR